MEQGRRGPGAGVSGAVGGRRGAQATRIRLIPRRDGGVDRKAASRGLVVPTPASTASASPGQIGEHLLAANAIPHDAGHHGIPSRCAFPAGPATPASNGSWAEPGPAASGCFASPPSPELRGIARLNPVGMRRMKRRRSTAVNLRGWVRRSALLGCGAFERAKPPSLRCAGWEPGSCD